MHRRVILNGRLIEAARARLPLASSAHLHGRGVFTTLAVFGGRPFQWHLHWARLVAHAARAGVECSHLAGEEVHADLLRLVEANGVVEGRARVTLVARASRGLWKMDAADELPSDLLIMTGEGRAPEHGTLALTVSPHRVNTLSPLAGLKTVNYLEQMLAWEEARSRDFDEAVRLNEHGEVVSAAMANIFWVTGGRIHTPALSTGALDGTTRACVTDLARELSYPLVEGIYGLHDLGEAEEIFLTSAGLGVCAVTAFDFHTYTVHVGNVTSRLREAYRQATIGSDLKE
jgi:branched-subunit amino acid aminotransferase/4-amino-4-deoxychorismate lyase